MGKIIAYIIIGVAGLAVICSGKLIKLKEKRNEGIATLIGVLLLLLSAFQLLWLFFAGK